MRFKFILKLSYSYFLLSLVLIGCNSSSSTPVSAEEVTVQFKESENIFKKNGEKIRLSSFKKTVFTETKKLISIASYLDFSSGKSQSVYMIYYHEENNSYHLDEPYLDHHIIGMGQSRGGKLPLLVAKPLTEQLITLPKILIWDLEEKHIIQEISLSHNFCDNNYEFYKQYLISNENMQLNCDDAFVFPYLFSNLSTSEPYLEFNGKAELIVVFPTISSLIGYKVDLESSLVSETTLGGPSYALQYPPRFKAINLNGILSINTILMPFQESSIVLGGQNLVLPKSKHVLAQIKWNPENKISASLAAIGSDGFEPDLSYIQFLNAEQFYTMKTKNISLNDNQYNIDFFELNSKIFELHVRDSFFKVNWSGLYQNKYIILIGEAGDRHAATYSLIQAGSIFVIIIDKDLKKVILASEYHTGNKHLVVSGGINLNQLWFSFNHNWGGNHDGDTVRRSTSGRVITLDLSKLIRNKSSLKINSDSKSFRKLSSDHSLNLNYQTPKENK